MNWPPDIGIKPYYSDEQAVIYHGDARDILPFLPRMDLTLVDPPYGTKVEKDGYGRRQNYGGVVGRHISGDEDCEVMEEVLRLAPTNLAACFFSPKKLTESCEAFKNSGWNIWDTITWDKLIPGLGGGIRYQHENIALLCRGERYSGGGQMFSVIRQRSDSRADGHPHSKPPELLGRLISYFSARTIVDPCMGSGSSLVAAKSHGARIVGIEVESQWCAAAVERLRQQVLITV